MAVIVLLMTLTGCSDDGDRGGESSGDPTDGGLEQIGTAKSACDLPVLVRVPEKWVVEAMTPEMVKRADDKRLTSPGGFELVCSLLGSPAGISAPIFLFVAPPSVARDLTADQLLRRFMKAAHDDVTLDSIDTRAVTVDAGAGVEGSFATSRVTPGPVRLRAFVLPTPNGAVVVANGGLHQETVDAGIPAYESVRDSMNLRD